MIGSIKKLVGGIVGPKIGSIAILEQGDLKTAIRLLEYAKISPLEVAEWFRSKSEGYEFLALNELGFHVVKFKIDKEVTKADFKGFECIPEIGSLDQYFAIKMKTDIYWVVLKRSAQQESASGKSLEHLKKMEKLVQNNPYVQLKKAKGYMGENKKFPKFISGTGNIYETELKPSTRSFVECLIYTLTDRIPVEIGIKEKNRWWLLAINDGIQVDPRDISVSFKEEQNLDVYTFHFKSEIEYLFELEKDEKAFIEKVAAVLGKDVPVLGVKERSE